MLGSLLSPTYLGHGQVTPTAGVCGPWAEVTGRRGGPCYGVGGPGFAALTVDAGGSLGMHWRGCGTCFSFSRVPGDRKIRGVSDMGKIGMKV